MQAQQRYEIIDVVGQGDFAVVYKARDRELGREVAVKQIHQQFLADPKQLEKYWQEAQLLASLEHPNVMTIYDIVRSQGWLVVELMQGSLKDRTAGQPMKLDFLRVTLFHCLHALKFLHEHGILHGDIKPGNLLIDKRNRIKIGDFGLARRAASGDGSLLKGTTKYIAPEVLSDQFGPVGPSSDLYSLGFSAYELLCGEHFETLFPGLNAFGRDKQLAWMMWHAAPDRRLPPISRVMEGVPADLATVIERLVEKDPARRYQSADQALADLVQQPGPATSAPAAEPPPNRTRQRMLAIGALTFSLLMCGFLLFSGGAEPPPAETFEPLQGAIRRIIPAERRLLLDMGDNRKPEELAIGSAHEIRLNDKFVDFRELREGDRVRVTQQVRDGAATLLVTAYRPETNRGQIHALQPEQGLMTFSIEEGAHRGTRIQVQIDGQTQIVFNDEPASVGQLAPGDKIEVLHAADGVERVALEIKAQRPVTLDAGVVRNVDLNGQKITLSLPGDDATLTLPYDAGCQITINNLRYLNNALIQPSDLRPGDAVHKIVRDTRLREIHVARTLTFEGVVAGLRSDGALSLDVRSLADADSFVTFRLDANVPIRLGGESVRLSELYPNDVVQITHQSLDLANPQAQQIEARRPVDPSRWVLLIGVQNYDDRQAPRPPTVASDLARLREAVIRRYAVPPAQAQVLSDASRINLEQGVPEFLAKAAGGRQLLVYFAGQAFVDEEETVYLAPRDFALGRIASSGLPLSWLVRQVDASPVPDKLLLLDAAHELPTDLRSRQPSTARMIDLLKARSDGSPFKSLTILTSCSAEQRPLKAPDGSPGMFAEALAQAFEGQADRSPRDMWLNSAEVYEFVRDRLARQTGANQERQTPQLFIPVDERPRLTAEAQTMLRSFVTLLDRDRPDAAAAESMRRQVERLTGNEPEPVLIHGLALLKGRNFRPALTVLEPLKIERPDLLSAHEGAAWAHFELKNLTSGLAALSDMAAAIPIPKRANQQYDEHALAAFRWAGGLREFAAAQLDDSRPEIARLDREAAKHLPVAQEQYEAGRSEIRKRVAEYDSKLEAAKEDEKPKLRLERRLVVTFCEFDFDAARQRLLDRIGQ